MSFQDIINWIESWFTKEEPVIADVGPLVQEGQILVADLKALIADIKAKNTKNIIDDAEKVANEMEVFIADVTKLIQDQQNVNNAQVKQLAVSTDITTLITAGEKIVADLEGIVNDIANRNFVNVVADLKQTNEDVQNFVADVEGAFQPHPFFRGKVDKKCKRHNARLSRYKGVGNNN
jgi:hypothetical protein